MRSLLVLLSFVACAHGTDVTVTSAPTSNLKSGECVGNYGDIAAEDYDYFPDKFDVGHADIFTVTYHKTYKIITSSWADSTHKVVAYQCGTTVPGVDITGDADLVVPVPVTKVGIVSSTHVPWIELLDERASIKHYTSPVENIASPCLKAAAGVTYSASDATGAEMDASLTSADVDVTFGDHWTKSTHKIVLLSDTHEKHPLEVAEYVGVIGALYNKEDEAMAIHENIESRYACVKANTQKLRAAAASFPVTVPTPKVLWFNYYSTGGESGWSVGTCPNWYCTIIEDAGGELLSYADMDPANTVNGYKGYLSDEQLLSRADQADYLILYGGIEEALVEKQAAVLDKISAWETGGFHTSGRGKIDWFGSRIAEPDVLLEDMVVAINSDIWSNAVMQPHNPVWIKSATEAPGSRGVCADPNAPLQLMADACTTLSTDLAGITVRKIAALNGHNSGAAKGEGSAVLAMALAAAAWAG
jgi:iron complex transport system substrate-binding protein